MQRCANNCRQGPVQAAAGLQVSKRSVLTYNLIRFLRATSIRDETLREGLMQVGAVAQREDLATTSSKPRYYLKADFASLFDPKLTGDDLASAIEQWQIANLSASSLARLRLASGGAVSSGQRVPVLLPNGETRQMAFGPSSDISKAVVESFAIRFLESPAVLWISESGNKAVASDEALAKSIGLNINVDKDLPDIILADVGNEEILIVFVEVVASDGPVSARRKAALLKLTDEAGFERSHVTFVTAYMDRENSAFKKTISSLAWGTFAWFVSEPSQLIALSKEGDQTVRKLHDWLTQ